MCTKYEWSVYGYHRLPSLKEDVVLHITRQPLKTTFSEKKRIIFIGALAYMHIFVVMFEMYMLCVSSDISHHVHVYYTLYYTMLDFLALLEFEIKLSIYIFIPDICTFLRKYFYKCRLKSIQLKCVKEETSIYLHQSVISLKHCKNVLPFLLKLHTL